MTPCEHFVQIYQEDAALLDSGFTQDATTSLQEICDAHSKVLGSTH